ncbi:MAG TPA: TRAM domain-containing protein [Ilumatobacter sp.]|nr:TRAM domain-containing protein [Ilumatobacter sp.]
MAPIQVRPERFVAGGEALARDVDGRVVFVRGGLPGELVDIDVTEQKPDWSRGVAVTVHESSTDRVEPPCPQRRAGCGGCDWQHLAVGAQIAAKADIVRDALRRTAKLPDAVVTVGASVPAEAYRTTIRVVGDRHGQPSYRQERSNDTVEANGCLVAHPQLRTALNTMLITPDLEVTLRTSVATGEVTARWDSQHGEVHGLSDDIVFGQNAYLTETINGKPLRVSSGSFFQSGPEAAELLVEAVQRAAPELARAATVLDAYAGVGLFAAAAVRPEALVITVENSKSAVADCRVNLKGRAFSAELSEFGRWRPPSDVSVDVVIADPARTGLGKPGVGTLVAIGAPVAVLVSCDPVALARDAQLLHQHGYAHDGTEVLDLFPHTHHVEAVTRFVRRTG